MFNLKKCVKSKKGQTLVETALVLPVILLILLGIMEFGRLFSNYLIVSNASREGARYAALNEPYSQVESVINDLFVSTGLCEEGKVSDYVTITPDYYEDSVEIKVSYKFNFIAPKFLFPTNKEDEEFDGTLYITSKTRMRLE